MIKHIINWILITVVIFIAAGMISGIEVNDLYTAFIVAAVLGIINIFIKPIIKLFALPITIITLGLFSLIINALLIILASKVVDGFSVDGFISAIVFSLVLSVAHFVLDKVVKK